MEKVRFLDLKEINSAYKREILVAVERVIDSGWFVLGNEVATFEKEFAAYIGSRYAVGVGNGLDALTIILRAWKELGLLKPGDEIIVPANTYIASILAVSENGLNPVLVEPDERNFNLNPDLIEKALSSKTRAIMAVHLYGQVAPMRELKKMAEERGLLLMEDCAQSQGALLAGQRAGSWSDAGAFSFFPGKNLGGLGDAGAITTDNEELAETCRKLGNYGSSIKYYNDFKGVNSRLDEIQAAILSVKLKTLDHQNELRRQIADLYLRNIDNAEILLPKMPGSREEHVWHLFVTRTLHRTALQNHLRSNGIETLMHYPLAPHKQKAYRELADLRLDKSERLHEEVLSLPIYPTLSETQALFISEVVNSFRP